MLKKNQNKQKLNSTERTAFLIDDEESSSKHDCYGCSQYQQDINLLQQKLMQTHNKLIDQIDICRQQQMKIIKLSANLRDGENNQLAGNRSQTGKSGKKNDQQYLHSIQPLIQAKTELLRNDLQAMRAKVLSQIMKSNKLKQQNYELEKKHQIQLQDYRQKMKRIEAGRNKLVDQNQKLLQQLKLNVNSNKSTSSSKCNCGFETKYYELDKAFMNQRLVTNQLIEENSRLQNKIQDLYQQRAKNHETMHSNHKVQQIRTEPKKRKNQTRQKYKQEFEATKNLIKQLEQAQLELRNRHNTKN